MDDFDAAERLRRILKIEGLDQETPDEIQEFYFDLNMGQVRLPEPTASRVWRVVRLARTMAQGIGYGEDIALMNLVTRKVNLDKPMVYWERPYYVPNLVGYISLSSWLLDNGVNISTIQ